MSGKPTSFVVQHNGRSATAGDLGPLAFAGYAHFTALQVRGGKTNNGAVVEGGNCQGNWNQQWFLEPAR